MAQGEGVAYRGRVLVSLETHLGEMPETEVEDLLNEDVYKVQVRQNLDLMILLQVCNRIMIIVSISRTGRGKLTYFRFRHFANFCLLEKNKKVSPKQ